MAGEGMNGSPTIDYAALRAGNGSVVEDGVNKQERNNLLAEIQAQLQTQKDALEQGDDATIHDKLLRLIPIMLRSEQIGTADWELFLTTLQASMNGLNGDDATFAGALLEAFADAEDEYKGSVETMLQETDDKLTEEAIEVNVGLLDGVSEQQRKNIYKYFSDVLAKGDKSTRKELSRRLRDMKFINAPSFFQLLFNGKLTASEQGINRSAVGYVAKGNRLDRSERKVLNRLITSRTTANGEENQKVKQGIQYLASVYGSPDFSINEKDTEGGKLMGYIDQAKTVREADKTSETGADLLQHLVSDTDLDGGIEALTQGPTPTRRTRRKLEKAQRSQGRGVLSEEGINALFTKAKRKIDADGKTNETYSADDIMAQNIVTYLTSQPRFSYLSSELQNIQTITAFMDMLFAHPELVGALRDYARLAPSDFMRVLEGGTAYVAERARSQTESGEKIEADRQLVEDYLKTEKGTTETAELLRSLDQKFRGIAISLESQKQKIADQLEAANTGVEAMDDQTRLALVTQYTALNNAQSTLTDPTTAHRAMVDLVHIGGLVSVIPGAEGVGAGATFRFYENAAKSLLQSIDMQVGGFQGIGGPGATGVGLNIVAGGTIQQSRKNTLFYALNGGTGMQLVQGIRGFGWNAGLTFGDEFWINEKKMKQLTPTSKVMIGALVSAGVAGDFTKATPTFKPRSAQAGLYLRWDKLAGLEAQQAEIFVTIQEILSKASDTSVTALHTLITQYCTEQKIKQTPEEIDRVARVLSSALAPYALQLPIPQGTTMPGWTGEVAEQIARNWFNSSVDDMAGFAISGVGLGVGFNFLGIYPSVGVQAKIRKSSVYAPDKDSQARAQAAFEQATYDEKFAGSFADNIDKINTRFGLTEEGNKFTKVTRSVGSVPAYDFVHIPLSVLEATDPRVELSIAPLLVDEDTSFRFQQSADGLGIDLPGTMAVSIVQEVRDGVTINKIVVGDTMGKNATPIEASKMDSYTFATNDDWIAEFQAKTESIFFDEKINKVQEQLFAFLKGQVDAGWQLPYDLSQQSNVVVEHTLGDITGYQLKLKSGVKFHGALPTGVTQSGDYLVVPPQIQLNVLHSTAPEDAAAPWYLTAEQNTTGLSFGYSVESTGFSQTIENDVNLDLLQNVDQRLRDFISSTEGAEMLMKWRYDTSPVEKDKETYYQLMRTALKDGNYQPVYNFAKTYIDASLSDDAKAVFTGMLEGGITVDDRANLYLIYGALSRVRMTEYKHLQDPTEKLAIFDGLIQQLGGKISQPDVTYLRDCLQVGNCDPSKTEAILRDADSRFKGWGLNPYTKEGMYYYQTFKDRKDPMYRLIFLFAPVAKVFETRTTATDKRLQVEFQGDPQSAAALNHAYQIVQQSLNTNPQQLFAEQNILDNDVGLIFGYGPREIDEKFVFYPKSTGARIDLVTSTLTPDEQQRVKKYYLDEYCVNNPFDVQAEVESIVAGISEALKDQNADMLPADREAKIIELKNALLAADGTFKPNAYKELMLTGKIPSLDRFNTNNDSSLLTFSTDRGIAAYSECVNFMIIKGKPKIQMKLKKIYVMPAFEPKPVDLQMVSHPGEVVAEQVVVQNQATRREKNISLGLIGGVYKEPETGESATLPVDISEEDFNNIQLDPTPSRMTISTTGEIVNAFAGSFGNKSGMFYIDPAGNWKFFEGSVVGGPNNTLIFNPATQATNVSVGDVLYTGRHLGQLGPAAVGALMQAKLKQLPYDAYQKQMIDLRTSEIENIKKRRQPKTK